MRSPKTCVSGQRVNAGIALSFQTVAEPRLGALWAGEHFLERYTDGGVLLVSLWIRILPKVSFLADQNVSHGTGASKGSFPANKNRRFTRAFLVLSIVPRQTVGAHSLLVRERVHHVANETLERLVLHELLVDLRIESQGFCSQMFSSWTTAQKTKGTTSSVLKTDKTVGGPARVRT